MSKNVEIHRFTGCNDYEVAGHEICYRLVLGVYGWCLQQGMFIALELDTEMLWT